MALLTSCLCCNLLLGAIVSGVYVAMVYLLAFIIYVWWIVEEEGGGGFGEGVPAPAYLLCLVYLSVAAASAWMLLGLYKKKARVLLAWVFLMTLFCFPEMGMVAFMAFIHWKITSPYGLGDLIFYVFRAAFNLLSVLCVQSQYCTWRDAANTCNTLKRLQHMQHSNSVGKSYVGEGGGGREGGGGEVSYAYPNPVFLGSQEATPTPQPALPHPHASLTRSLSRASSLRGWGGTEGGTVAMSPPIQVRTGLPGWDPYINRESQSEFNAATFSPASVGFMPLVSGSARSDLSLYSPPPPSSSPPLTVYHHSHPQHPYPLHLPHIPPTHLQPSGEVFSYAAATQSLDRRRYVRRWQGSRGSVGGGGGGVVMTTSSKSSLGGESDDFRRYRDVAL